jgi:HSP20 family protein
MTHLKFGPRAFEQTFNNLVDDFLLVQPSLYRNGAANKGNFNVPANIVKSELGYELQLAAPGFEKEAFQVSLEKGLLTVSAEHKEEAKQNFVRREFSRQSFKRSWTLDETIDAERIEASYNNGILVLTLPKKEVTTEPVKQISIQ